MTEERRDEIISKMKKIKDSDGNVRVTIIEQDFMEIVSELSELQAKVNNYEKLNNVVEVE